MENNDSNKSKREIYKEHVLNSLEFSGSDREFCRQHELSPSTFYHYKREMGLGRATSPNKFVRVKARASSEESSPKPHSSDLPDPQWVAQFLRAYLGPQ